MKYTNVKSLKSNYRKHKLKTKHRKITRRKGNYNGSIIRED
ncbi:MAG: hypothetical protein ACTS4W_01260 [Candidatus Hodgkinia cicadicola]